MITQYDPVVKSFTGNLPVRLSDLAGATFEQGYSDTLLGWLTRQSDFITFGDEGDELPPEELKARYGLDFDKPMREGRARLLSVRKLAEQQRMVAIQNGVRGAGSFALSMGAGLAGSVANPLDFAANVFLPFVGEAGTATKVGVEVIEGAGLLARTAARASRFATGRGLVSADELASAGIRSPVMHSIIEGTLANAAIEVPLAYEKIVQEHNEAYGIGDSLLNVAAGGAFAGGLRAAAGALARVLSRVSPDTHMAALAEELRAMAGQEEAHHVSVLMQDEALIRSDIEAKARQRVEAEIRQELGERGASVDESAIKRLVDERVAEQVSGFERVAPELPPVPDITAKTTPEQLSGQLELLDVQSAMPTKQALQARLTKAQEIEAKLIKQVEDSDFSTLSDEGRALMARAERANAVVESIKGRLSAIERGEISRLRAEPEVRSKIEAEAARNAELVESEKQARFQKYFDEMMPKDEEARRQWATKYQADRAAELDAAARNSSVRSDAQLNELAAVKTPEQMASIVDEDIAAMREKLPPELIAKLDETPTAKPDYQKALSSVVPCIAKSL